MTIGTLFGVILGVLFFSNTQYWLINKRIYAKMNERSCDYDEAVTELELGFPYNSRLNKSYFNSTFRKRLVRVRVAMGYVLCLLLLVAYIVVRFSSYSVYLEMHL